MQIENMSLDELFTAADAVGDKYLTPEEIRQRDAKLLKARTELWATLTDEDLDLL